MISGIGTDIIEIDRIARAVKSEHFIKRVFTTNEINYCKSRGRLAAASYAVRFAGKEAFFKALGTGIICPLTCVEILNDKLGCPYLNVSDQAAKLISDMKVINMKISLSHSRDSAVATCIFETMN